MSFTNEKNRIISQETFVMKLKYNITKNGAKKSRICARKKEKFARENHCYTRAFSEKRLLGHKMLNSKFGEGYTTILGFLHSCK